MLRAELRTLLGCAVLQILQMAGFARGLHQYASQ